MIYTREITEQGGQSVGERLENELFKIQNTLEHRVLGVHESKKVICGQTYQSFIIVCDNGEGGE